MVLRSPVMSEINPRGTPPNRETIGVYWGNRSIPGHPNRIAMFTEEPQCFACGWHEINGRNLYAHLERAHVIPHSLGGPNAVENYALLCSECHRRAPNVGDPQWFWDWVAAHELDGEPFAWPFECVRAAVDVLTQQEQEIVATWPVEEIKQRWLEAAGALGGITIVARDGLSPGTVAALMKTAVRNAKKAPEHG
jgi:hypothetical protein